jgi:hypothetical protein
LHVEPAEKIDDGRGAKKLLKPRENVDGLAK